MTVSTTTDAPVDLEADLRLLPVTGALSDPFIETLSETLGAAVERVVQDIEAETVACLTPVEDEPSDARTAHALVEEFVLAAYRYRRYKTADGFEGPSAFLVHVGDDHDRASVQDGADRGRPLAAGTCTAPDRS